MKHFSLEEWADFARQTAVPDQRELMQLHLDDGCKRCLKALEIWQGVYSVAKKEFLYQPPESAVHRAKVAFVSAWRAPSGRMSFARLIFDSFRVPVPAGLRNSRSATRQALYRSGQFLIDTRVDSEPDSNRISLTGQVLDATRPHRRIEASSIYLLREKKLLARTGTNQFGEFQLDFEGRKGLRLLIEIKGQRTIAVSLQSLEASETHV